MNKPIELHGTLLDGQPCELSLSSNSFELEVADHLATPQRAVAPQPVSDPTIVQLADGRIATLSDTYLAGFRSHLRPGTSFVLGRTGANRVAIGSKPFDATDLVNSIQFRPTNELVAEYYLAHRGHTYVNRGQTLEIDQLFSNPQAWGTIVIDSVDRERLVICHVDVGNVTICLRVELSVKATAQGSCTEEARIAEISYTDPVTVNLALKDVDCLCNFFSLTIGTVVAPTGIVIRSGPVDNFGIRPGFEFHAHSRPSAGSDLDPAEANRCLLSNPVDGIAYEASLREWFSRREEWQHTYNLGSDCLARQNEISRHRYVDAVNWFEAIPLFYHRAPPPLPTEMIRKAADAAAAVFRAGAAGAEVSEDRLFNLLAPLNAPSLATRLRSALAHVRERFGQSALPPGAEALISRAVSIRGAFSHGTYALQPNRVEELYEATLLIETVCGLLTLSGLQWELSRLARAHFHPMQSASASLFQFASKRG